MVGSLRLDDPKMLLSSVILQNEFFASFVILLAVRGGKINMGPLPAKFVTVPVALKF